MFPCDQKKTLTECFLSRIQKIKSTKQTSYENRSRNACQGTQKLNKNAFLSMIGSKKTTRITVPTTLKEEEVAKIQSILNANNGNIQRAAALLGISPSTLKMKIGDVSQEQTRRSDDELNSPNPSRKFFENLDASWSIKAFDPRKGEICVDVSSPSTTIHIASTVAISRNY